MLILSPNLEFYGFQIEENGLTDFASEKIDKITSNLKKIGRTCERKITEIEKKLLTSGIDVHKIKKDAKIAANKSPVKNGKISNLKDVLKTFSADLVNKKYFLNQTDSAPQVKNLSDESTTSVAGGILKSIALYAIIVFLNTYFSGFILQFVGNENIVKIITSIITAPLIEEAGKLISVKNNFTWEYFTVFNLGEFTLWTYRMITEAGINPISAMIIRIPAIIMHLVNTLIHVGSKEMNESGMGYKIAVALHSIFNAMYFLSSRSN